MKRIVHLAFVFVVAALASATGAPSAWAESSSWFTRSKEPEAKQPAPGANTAKTPSAAAKKAGQPKNPVATTVPATGDDAAYLAFDQGQYLTALKLAQDAAGRGEKTANTLIGRIYQEGLGVQKDEKTAANWYTRGAELGDVPAMFSLALMLAEGKGIEKNRNAAANLFEKAALTGHATANYNLGLMFLSGDGKPQNSIRAAQHIEYAAEKGIAQAQYDLAALYQKGEGVSPNAEQAAKWMSRAAEQGLATAQYDYAVMLLKGMGLTRDEPKAVGYMKAAAEKGLAGAQNRMAYINFEGVGVDKNPVEGARWRLIAKRGGIEDQAADDMVAKLSKADRATAEKAASEWADKIQVQPTE